MAAAECDVVQCTEAQKPQDEMQCIGAALHPACRSVGNMWRRFGLDVLGMEPLQNADRMHNHAGYESKMRI